MLKKVLKDKRLFKFLEKVDAEIAETAQAAGCRHCRNILHHGNYERMPRGGPEWDKRYSFCCSDEGCRKRTTPASVRFLGRKVYAGLVIVLISAMMHGLSRGRMNRLRESLGISERTLIRWRAWWQEVFSASGFWKVERSRFMPGLAAERLPLSLVEVFDAKQCEGLVKLMRFLSPITVPTRKEVAGM